MNGYEKNAGGVGQNRTETGQGAPKRGFGYSAKPMSRIDAVRANLASIDRVEERLFGDQEAVINGPSCPGRLAVAGDLATLADIFARAGLWHASSGSAHGTSVVGEATARLLRKAADLIGEGNGDDAIAEVGSEQLHAQIRVLEGERDQARELADQADGYLRRAEIAEGERDDAREQHANVVRSLDWVQEAFERREIAITGWGFLRGEAARQWVNDLKSQLATAEKRAEAFRETILEYAGQLTGAIEQRDAALDQLAKAEEAMLGNAQQRDDARAERDAAAENARDHLASLEMLRRAIDHSIASGFDDKPVCLGVTSPRFYSEEEREEAITAVMRVSLVGQSGGTVRSIFGRIIGGKIVDAVAQALGMRRAAK